MVERLSVEVGCVWCSSRGMVGQGERAKSVAVEGELARNEVDTMLLTGLVKIL